MRTADGSLRFCASMQNLGVRERRAWSPDWLGGARLLCGRDLRRALGQGKAPRLSWRFLPFAWRIANGALVTGRVAGCPGPAGGRWRREVLERLRVGLCAAACKLIRGCSAGARRGCLMASSRGFGLGLRCPLPSAPWSEKSPRGWDLVVSVGVPEQRCLVVEVSKRRRAQRTHSIPSGGGRGPSSGRSEDRFGVKRRRESLGFAPGDEGLVESCLLVEGVPGRESHGRHGPWWKRSRVRSSRQRGPWADAGRQSLGYSPLGATKSRAGWRNQSGETSRVA